MSENKGKPSKQKADERNESQRNVDPRSPRQEHRLDRSRGTEKSGKGELPRQQRSAR